MKAIYLFDEAIYGPTRFIVGNDKMAAKMMKWFDSKQYAYDCYEIDIHQAQQIANKRSNEEEEQVFKWMDKCWKAI
jgi:hypothetical protein